MAFLLTAAAKLMTTPSIFQGNGPASPCAGPAKGVHDSEAPKSWQTYMWLLKPSCLLPGAGNVPLAARPPVLQGFLNRKGAKIAKPENPSHKFLSRISFATFAPLRFNLFLSLFS